MSAAISSPQTTPVLPRPAWLALLAVLLLTLPAMWPFLSHGGYWQSDDGVIHLYRLFSLEGAWRQGQLYPRLFPDFAFGYGFSVLNFYGPLSYYLALWLRGLGADPVGAMRLAFALSYPASALAMGCLARDLWRRDTEPPNDLAGVVAAAAYIYVPYHLANVQFRGALAESWALVWWPLILWAIWRERPWLLALTTAALIATHNLSVLLAAPVALLWVAIVLIRRARRGQPVAPLVGRFAAAGLIALALTAPYWLPVALESRYVWVSQDLGGMGFTAHIAPLAEWVAPGLGYHYRLAPDDLMFRLSWAQAALLLAAIPASLWLLRRQRHLALPVGAAWLMVLASIFFLTPASLPVWRLVVRPLGLLQYPWRWLGVATVATALVASAPLAGAARLRRLWLPVAGAALLWMAVGALRALPWQPLSVDPRDHPAQMWAQDAANGQVGASWTAEFLPLTVTEQRWALSYPPSPIPSVDERSPLRLISAQSDGFTLRAEVEAEAAAPLTFPRFAYPSFRATVDGQPVEVTARSPLALATVDLPAGRHTVVLQAQPLAARPLLARLLWLPWLGIALYALWRPAGRRWLLVALLATLPLVALRAQARAYEFRPVERTEVGPTIQLMGARLPAWSLRAGESLPLTLLWFNREQAATSYSSFIHLTTADGTQMVVGDDNVPNELTVPTTRWLPGQLIEDLHLLRLPESLPPGEYALWGGMYEVGEGQAVPLPGDDGARRPLGLLTIAP